MLGQAGVQRRERTAGLNGILDTSASGKGCWWMETECMDPIQGKPSAKRFMV